MISNDEPHWLCVDNLKVPEARHAAHPPLWSPIPWGIRACRSVFVWLCCARVWVTRSPWARSRYAASGSQSSSSIWAHGLSELRRLFAVCLRKYSGRSQSQWPKMCTTLFAPQSSSRSKWMDWIVHDRVVASAGWCHLDWAAELRTLSAWVLSWERSNWCVPVKTWNKIKFVSSVNIFFIQMSVFFTFSKA